MFEQTFLPAPARTRRAWTVAVSFGCQMVLIGALVVMPLLSWERLKAAERIWLPAPPTAAPAPPPHVKVVAVERAPRPTQIAQGVLVEPTRMPKLARQIVDPPPEPAEPSGGTGAGVVGGLPGAPAPPDPVLRSLTSQQHTAAPPPAPAVVKPPAQAPKQQVRISQLDPAMLIERVTPVYPALARATRVSGTVVLSAVIGTDGRIRELKVVSGHPLLAPAALDAVRQWRYRPTLLGGAPVEVITTIQVHFTLTP